MAAGASQRPPEGSPRYPGLACSLGLRKTLGVQAQSFLRRSRDSAGHASSPSLRIAAPNSCPRLSGRFPQCASAFALVHGPRQPALNLPSLSATKPHVLIAITRPSAGNCAPSARTHSAPVTSASFGNCAPLAPTCSAITSASFGNCAPLASTSSAPVTSASFGNCAPPANTHSQPVTSASFGNCAPSAHTYSAITSASFGNCAPLASTSSAPVTSASFGNCAPPANTHSQPVTSASTRQVERF